jgi:phosphoribosylglycinamide formyltransferase 1
VLRPLYDSSQGKMKIAGLVSGSGVSLVGILDQQKEMEAQGKACYEVVGIFTENPASKAVELGERYRVPVFTNDMKTFYEKRGARLSDLKVREEFDRQTVGMLKPLGVHALAYAGYVWITTKPLVEAFIGINFHPADLSIEEGGKKKFTGAHGVRDALLAGEKQVAATLHIVTTEVDSGPILLISKPINVERKEGDDLEEVSRYYLKLLNKEKGPLFARAAKDLAEGRFRRDEKGCLYYGETSIPRGHRLQWDRDA